MDLVTVEMHLPRDLLGTLDVPERSLETKLRELIALELFREGLISSGKGAELLGLDKATFIKLLDRHEIDYFDLSLDEVMADATAAQPNFPANPTAP